MAQPAVPVRRSPRTITVRVRTAAIAGAVLVAAGLVWWMLSWASGMQPLSIGSSVTGPRGLRVAARTPEAFGSGPTAYVWRPGGSYVVTVQIHNTASVPVTITGVDGTPSDWNGLVSGPTIENGDGRTLEPVKGPFRHVRIAPDGYGVVALTFRANPGVLCGTGGSGSLDSVTLNFTTLDMFHDSQSVPLGDLEPVMTVPRSGC
jgi:hypothetical protein